MKVEKHQFVAGKATTKEEKIVVELVRNLVQTEAATMRLNKAELDDTAKFLSIIQSASMCYMVQSLRLGCEVIKDGAVDKQTVLRKYIATAREGFEVYMHEIAEEYLDEQH